MRQLLTILACAAAFAATGAHAADAAKHKTVQQEKMAACNKDAEGKKGDERKAFMSTCLSSKSSDAVKSTAHQDKMKSCNHQAAGKKGDEHKAFMKECLAK